MLCQGRIVLLSAVPPWIHRYKICALSRILTYPRQLTYATRCRILCEFSWSFCSHLTAPSAVHLTTCFLSGSQQARTLCEGIIAVISASSVCYYLFVFCIITLQNSVVNINKESFLWILHKKLSLKLSLCNFRTDNMESTKRTVIPSVFKNTSVFPNTAEENYLPRYSSSVIPCSIISLAAFTPT